MDLVVVPTPGGSILAALALAGGARWFADGLRALRLNRALRGVAPRPLEDLPTGLVQVSGTVALDSPMFGPLSGKPCAGFVLAVRGRGRGLVAHVREMRSFRLVAGGVTARVLPERAACDLDVVAEREVTSNHPLTTQLAARLALVPEAAWLRRLGAPFRLVERSLLADQECHVVGWASHQLPIEVADISVLERRVELQRTGTDDLAVAIASNDHPVASPDEPDLWIDEGSPLDLLSISSHRVEPVSLAPHRLRVLGTAGGPFATLAGLLYLAQAVEDLRLRHWTL